MILYKIVSILAPFCQYSMYIILVRPKTNNSNSNKKNYLIL